MKNALIAALALAFTGVTSAAVMAAGPGSCGKGKVWDADAKTCVAKPRGTGSNAG